MSPENSALPSAFDAYWANYEHVVQASIDFSGLDRAFFIQAKIDLVGRLLAEHFGPGSRPSLLDVGCGVGAMHDALLPLVGSLAGTDPSGRALERAGRERPAVDYRHQDGPALPWPDAAVDATLAVCVLHHVPPARRDGLVAEMRRVTRPGGLAILIEHNPWNPLTRLAVARCPFDEDAVLLGVRAARGLLRGAGFGHVGSRHFLLLPTAHRLAGRLERRLASLPLGAQYAVAGTA